MPPEPCALTIAGHDPSAGAGVTADLAVFAAHGIFGTSAITALTVQSTVGVKQVSAVSAPLLRGVLEYLEADLPPAGIKVGMLADEPQVQAVAMYLRYVREHRTIPVVLDPVLQSSSGAMLLTVGGRAALKSELLAQIDFITPNTDELALLTGLPCRDDEEIEAASRLLTRLHPHLGVLTTGGHRDRPVDLLWHGDSLHRIPGERIETQSTHGTGCALSTSLLCGLLQGKQPAAAAMAAKRYVEGALRSATPRGSGQGPMHLMWSLSGHTKA